MFFLFFVLWNFYQFYVYEFSCKGVFIIEGEEKINERYHSMCVGSTRHHLNDKRDFLAGNSSQIIFIIISLAYIKDTTIFEKVGEIAFRRGTCTRKDESLCNPVALFLAFTCHALLPRFPGRVWQKICLALYVACSLARPSRRFFSRKIYKRTRLKHQR